MLFSLALIFILGAFLGLVFEKIHLPEFLGMIFAGIILGYFNLLSADILLISADLRQIALIIILIRAGLNLNLKDLQKIGRPAVFMSFVPAVFEMLAITVFAKYLFNISFLEAGILGCVLAAVSPAVIVPRMLKLIDEQYGTKNGVPQLIMAGASVDDIFVIVIFTTLTNLANGENLNLFSILQIPLRIILGIVLGVITGYILNTVFKKIKLNGTINILIILSSCFIFTTLEDYLPISGLIAVMSMGVAILHKDEQLANKFSKTFSKIWVGAQILLFVLVGASVDVSYLFSAGVLAVIIVLIGLIFRVTGVFASLYKTQFNSKEKLFCAVAYIPKATVQAAIGGLPLAMGLSCGNLVLTVAIVAILISAPLGAILIDKLYLILLKKDNI